jgi:predicted dehydrogenase
VISDGLAIEEGSPESVCDGGVFFDLDDALETTPDIVVVANPTSLHAPVAIAAARAGAHIFLEKPVSDSLESAYALRAEVVASKVQVVVGCQLRFHPAIRLMRQLLGSDAIGSLIAVHIEQAEYLPGFHPFEDYRRSYAARRDLGGGVTLTQIHEIDYALWLFGKPDSVFAVGGKSGALEVEVEDVASALWRVPRMAADLPVHIHLDYLQRPGRRRCRVVGDRGTIELDLREQRLVWSDVEGEVRLDERFTKFERAQLFRDEISHVIDVVRDGVVPEITLDDGIVALEVAAGILRSIETGVLERVSAS